MTLSRLAPLTLLLACACGTTTPPDSPLATSTAAPVESAAPVAAQSGEALCAGFADTQKQALTRALAPVDVEVKDDTPMDKATATEVLTPLGTFCQPTKKGAWATLVESTSPAPWTLMGGFQAKWSLVHIAPDGAQTKAAPPSGAVTGEWNFAASVSDPSTLDPPVVFDFDGDGDDEIGLVLHGHIHEGESWALAHLWTFREGALKRYTPAEAIRFDSFEDPDHDGRPDLVGFGEYDVSYENCCSGFAFRATGPKLVAHSAKDGSFASGDAFAASFAKASCATAAKPIATKGKPWEVEAVLLSVACARLEGRTAADVKAELDKAIPRSRAKEACDMQTCQDPNTLRAAADGFADLAPPVQLPK